jgi:predicted enzyme related to lactoylglutathione lyase
VLTIKQSGTIGWTEIPVQDVHRAMKFYKDAFGWAYNISHSNDPETGEENKDTDNYVFHKSPTYGSFRIVEKQDHLSPSTHPSNVDRQKLAVTVSIRTDNLDDTLKVIEKAGGSSYM